jgi:uncharacterized protein
MSWIQTYTGVAFDITNAKMSDLNIGDIAHSLSMQCRFNGHTNRFYSVAEHSLVVTELVSQHTNDPWILMQALLHDGSEAYLCDIPRPIKPLLIEYKVYERQIEQLIFARWDCEEEMNPLIKSADIAALLMEKNKLMSKEPMPWAEYPIDFEFKTVNITGLMPFEAKTRFLEKFDEIQDDIDEINFILD